jgi:N-acetylmuramoyl-L-alanine amidase
MVGPSSAQAPASQAPASQAPASQAPASQAATASPAGESNFPIASDARLAGDAKQTRFILDLDKSIQFRAFALADPYRVIVDLPQVSFQLPAGAGGAGRGLVKAFRYGVVMPGGSRIVFDLTGPARIAKSYVLEAANGQPPRLVLEFEEVDRTAFVQSLAPENRPELRPAIAEANAAVANVAAVRPDAPAAPKPAPGPPDKRPVIVIDPGHGGEDNGTEAGGADVMEKNLVLSFGLALRDRIEKSGKYRVVMTRTDDTFVALADRVKVARSEAAALFISIHAIGRCRKQVGRDRRGQARRRADRSRRHPDRPGAAGDQDLLEPLRPDLDGRNEDHGADAQASAEIGRFPGPEGPRRALGPGRARLCLEQGRP